MDARTGSRAVAVAVAVLALGFVVGCTQPPPGASGGGGSGGGQPPTSVTLTDADNGKTAEVANGGTVQVQLQGNPTTGYGWTAAGEVPPILSQQGEPSFKAGSDAIGAGGMVTLTFKAVQTGEGDLKLEYKRSWETTVPAAKTWSSKVVVK